MTIVAQEHCSRHEDIYSCTALALPLMVNAKSRSLLSDITALSTVPCALRVDTTELAPGSHGKHSGQSKLARMLSPKLLLSQLIRSHAACEDGLKFPIQRLPMFGNIIGFKKCNNRMSYCCWLYRWYTLETFSTEAGSVYTQHGNASLAMPR